VTAPVEFETITKGKCPEAAKAQRCVNCMERRWVIYAHGWM